MGQLRFSPCCPDLRHELFLRSQGLSSNLFLKTECRPEGQEGNVRAMSSKHLVEVMKLAVLPPAAFSLLAAGCLLPPAFCSTKRPKGFLSGALSTHQLCISNTFNNTTQHNV